MYNKLKAAFVALGLNQSDMATVAGMSEVSLSNKMNGKVDFTVSEACTFVKFLESKGANVSLDYLFKN